MQGLNFPLAQNINYLSGNHKGKYILMGMDKNKMPALYEKRHAFFVGLESRHREA